MKKILIFILTISISLCLLLTSLSIHAYNINGYMNSFRKYDIDDETGKTYEELENIGKDLISYLKLEGGEELLIPHFNQREIMHMEDVQSLFRTGKTLRDGSFFIILLILAYFIYKKDMDYCLNRLVFGLSANWIFLVLLSLVVAIDFNKYFIYFHKLLFTNELWIMDPETDLMIQMLPEGFFVSIVVKTIISFVLSLLVVQISAKILAIRLRKKKDKAMDIKVA